VGLLLCACLDQPDCGYPGAALQGYYCLTVKLTIVQGSGHMAGYIPVPPFDLHTITQVSAAAEPVVSLACASNCSINCKGKKLTDATKLCAGLLICGGKAELFHAQISFERV